MYVPTTANTAVNNASDVTIVTRDVTGVAAGDQLFVDAWFTILNNSTATRVYAVTLDFDGLFDIELVHRRVGLLATVMQWCRVQGVCDVRANNLAYAMVSLDLQTGSNARIRHRYVSSGDALAGKGLGTSTSDATGTLTVALKVRSANATATQTLRLHGFTIRKVTPT